MPPVHATAHDVEWSPEVAEALAARASVSLRAAHWSVLGCARELWLATGRVPSLDRVAACTGMTELDLVRLFTADAESVLLRVAGIPAG
jgi:sulfur relay (sulfurtransferase) DsrC/TusE family protein